MCYDIKANLERQLKTAKKRANLDAVRDLEEKLRPYRSLDFFHVSGYSHPRMIIVTKNYEPKLAYWGLIPHWIKNEVDAKKFWNNTLNARGETIYDKPSFKMSARNKRCIIYIDGFYEHHHYKGKTYPFFIQMETNELMPVAGLWNEWINKETGEFISTFTIVTTKGNELLDKIHNNPKLKEPRMPVILEEQQFNSWLDSATDETAIRTMLKPYLANPLSAYTVNRLRGKEYLGNVEAITKPHDYPELVF